MKDAKSIMKKSKSESKLNKNAKIYIKNNNEEYNCFDTTKLSHVIIFVDSGLTNHANPTHKIMKIKFTQD